MASSGLILRNPDDSVREGVKMNSNLIAAVAGGLVIGAAAFVPMGGLATPLPAAGNTVTDEKLTEDSGSLIEEPTETEEATGTDAGTAGAAGTTGTSGGYSFNKGGEDDDDEDDDDGEDEDEEDEEDDEWEDDENSTILRGKWIFDGSKSIDDMIEKLRKEIELLEELKKEGYYVCDTVDDDYAFLRKNDETANV